MPRPRRIYSEEERRALLIRRGELGALAQHQSWTVYEAAVQEAIEGLRRTVLASAMSDQGISLEMQAYYRGVIRGLRGAVKVPLTAEGRLEEWLREQDKLREEASG